VTTIAPTPRGGDAEIAVVTSTFGRFLLGVEMTSVDAIEESQGIEQDAAPVLDISKLWNLQAVGDAEPRRVIALRTAAGRCRLLVGARAEVLGISPESLLPLPAFLEEVGRRAAVRALFAVGSGFGLLLDAERIEHLGRGGGGSTS
jgi:hypothetical protein